MPEKRGRRMVMRLIGLIRLFDILMFSLASSTYGVVPGGKMWVFIIKISKIYRYSFWQWHIWLVIFVCKKRTKISTTSHDISGFKSKFNHKELVSRLVYLLTICHT